MENLLFLIPICLIGIILSLLIPSDPPEKEKVNYKNFSKKINEKI